MQTDICGRFLESKCPDKGNVREFLHGLRVKHEELASVGVDIDEKDYRSTIKSSLPSPIFYLPSLLLPGCLPLQKP
jgi:hypothetical protein